MVSERRAASGGGGGGGGAEGVGKPRGRRHQARPVVPARQHQQGYFTAGLAALFLCLTALLVLLPLVLPPLPPPPLTLLLLPVGLMAVLLVLALVPSADGRGAATGGAVAASCLY